MRSQAGFTLLEVMIVLAIIGLVVAIAAPTWFRQRELSRQRACQENLAKIDAASEMYAAEFRLSNGTSITYPDDLLLPPGASPGQGFLKSTPRCPAGGSYTLAAIGDVPLCNLRTAPDFPHAQGL